MSNPSPLALAICRALFGPLSGHHEQRARLIDRVLAGELVGGAGASRRDAPVTTEALGPTPPSPAEGGPSDAPAALADARPLRDALAITFLALRNARTFLDARGVARTLELLPPADRPTLDLVRAQADAALRDASRVLCETVPAVQVLERGAEESIEDTERRHFLRRQQVSFGARPAVTIPPDEDALAREAA